MARSLVLWYDIVNPSDVWFFKPILSRLAEFVPMITMRDRAETIALATARGMKGKVVGAHHTTRLKKNIGVPARFLRLLLSARGFDVGLSFENGLAVEACRLKGRPSILFCDNDVKFIESGSTLQDIDNRLKSKAEHIVIPYACLETFRRFVPEERISTYDGFKEDVYIADFVPDKDFAGKVGVRDYVVVRPEALDSSYVGNAKSIVPEILGLLTKENVPIVYLPREKGDETLSRGLDVTIPGVPLDGLDLCYHARAVLTGSGTMAREAACMGIPAVSFFPGSILLAVDRTLAEEGKIMHSRDPAEIVRFALSNELRKERLDVARSKGVQDSVVEMVRSMLHNL
jgi:predicted glycosyltransferase